MLDNPAFIGAASVIVGGVIGAGASLLTTWLRQRSDERRHYRELLVSLALESWKQSIGFLQPLQKSGATVDFPPIDGYLIHSAMLADLIVAGKLDKATIERSLSEIHEVTRAVANLIHDHSERLRDHRERQHPKNEGALDTED